MSVPAITLNGDQHVHVEVLTGTYTELGATSSGGETVIIGGDTVNKDITDLYTITYDSTSIYGERAQTVYRTVEVLDTVPPIITILGDSTATIEGGLEYVDAGATCFDNYDGDISVNVFNPVNTLLISTYYVEYSARDSAGNLATATRTVLVVDTTPPEASLVGSETVYLDAEETFQDTGITATDTIDGVIPPERKFVTDRVVQHTLGTYTNDYWAEDIAGNVSTVLHRTIHIEDYTPPVITLRGSSHVVKQARTTPYVDLGATAVDYCDGPVSVTRTGSVNIGHVADYPLWYSAHDAAGNEAVPILRTVHVIDLIRPIITLNKAANIDVTIEAGTPFVDWGCYAKDNYDNTLVINARIVVNNPVNIWVPGDYTITYNVTDTNGNEAITRYRYIHVVITQGMYIQVVDEDTNEPLENIEVEYHEYDPINKYVFSDILFRATTDSSGMAHINIASAPEIGAFVMFGPLITDVDGFQYRQYNTRRIVWEGQDPFIVKFPKSETFIWKAWDEDGNLVRGEHPNYRYYMIHTKGKYYPTGPECYIFFGYVTNLDYDTIDQEFYFLFDDYAREQPDFNPVWPYYDHPAPPAYGLPAFSITHSTEVAMHILYYNVPNYGVVHLVADNGGNGYSCSRSGQLHIINGNFELLKSAMMAAQRFAQTAGGNYYQRMLALYDRYQVISNIISDPEKAVQSLSLLAEVLELREEGELLLAENNISIYRKGQVNVTVRSSNKAPMSGISVKITQLSHSFNFGINPETRYNSEISTGLDQAISDGFNSAFVAATLYQITSYEDLGIAEIKEKGFRVFAVRTIENADPTIPLDSELLNIWENNRSAFPDAFVARRVALFQYVNLLNGMDVISNSTIDYSIRYPMSIEEVTEVTQKSTYDAGINHEMIQNKKSLMIDSEFEGDYGKKFVLYTQTLDSSRTELPVDNAREGLISYVKRISNLPEFSQIDSIGLRAYPGFNTGYFNSWWTSGYCPTPIFYADLFRRLGSFNKLVHITELTIPSSTLAGDPLNGWYKSPWDEYSQLEYVDKFYSLAFGSPKVASICWKGLYDINPEYRSKNQGNGGLLTEGGDKKEVYYHIIDLIKNNWWSYEEGVTGGLYRQFSTKIFGGRYKVEITLPNNQVIIRYFDMEPRNILNLIIDTDYSAPIIPWKIPLTLPSRNTGYLKKFIEERGVG